MYYRQQCDLIRLLQFFLNKEGELINRCDWSIQHSRCFVSGEIATCTD
jgi:hypothetical protein